MQAVALTAALAARYGASPALLGFSVLNEPSVRALQGFKDLDVFFAAPTLLGFSVLSEPTLRFPVGFRSGSRSKVRIETKL